VFSDSAFTMSESLERSSFLPFLENISDNGELLAPVFEPTYQTLLDAVQDATNTGIRVRPPSFT
jgi:hypothetical protein